MQVFVENPNTIVIDVDQGRQGRGIQNITYTEVSGQYFLIVTYTDGTTETLGPLVITGGAAFLLGGTTGSIPYQNAPNTTVFLPIGTQNQVVVAGATAPQYTSALTGLTVNNSAIGNTAPSTGAFTNLSASGTFALTGDQVQISEGGTGQTTANGAFNALAPSQTGNAGKYLKTDGTNSSWDQLDISTADITGTLPIANGGTGQTTANSALNALLPTQAAQSGKYLKTDGTNASWDQLDISTADITGVLPIANGGTGASTASGARANLSAAILGANNDITSMTGVTGGISTPDFVQFDTTATEVNAVGKVYWDAVAGTLDLGLLGGNVISRIGQSLVAYVTNAEAVTITKGQAVYLFSAQGDRATVKLAYNTSDATSAKTFGVVAENIGPNQTGFVMCQGVLEGLNLAAFTAGDTLYLGATPGSLTATKPAAPNHLVYVGLVERANAGNGQLYVKVQNGYELDEIHDVQIVSPQNGQTIIYDASTSLWKNANLTAGTGVSVTNGPASVTIGNTGVLSFSGGTTGLTPATSTTGAVTLGGTLATTNGGTGLTSFTANRVFYASSTSAIGQSANLTFDGTTLTANNFTDSSLTSGRVTYATTGGNLTDSANLLFDGTTLTANALTTTSTVTINGGTANGVAYLNGSKVLTSGSALSFDGTNLSTGNGSFLANGTTGITSFRATTTSNYAELQSRPDISYSRLLSSAYLLDIATLANQPILFTVNSTEQMRLTSTGLGIGTSSPTTKVTSVYGLSAAINGASPNATTALTLAGGDTTVSAGSGTLLQFRGIIARGGVTAIGGVYEGTNKDGSFALAFYRNSGNGTIAEAMRLDSSGNLGIGTSSPATKLEVSGSAAVARISGTSGTVPQLSLSSVGVVNWSLRSNNDGASDFTIYQDSTQRLKIDSSGNLGLGVTPTVQSGGALQLATGKYVVFSNNGGSITGNAIDNSGWKYINTNFASRYEQNTGTHAWFTAPSGTAGNAISFTQAMTLDASGRLLIGSTSSFSSAAKLQVQDNISLETNGTGGKLEFFSYGVSRGQISLPATAGQMYIVATSILSFGTSSTERARITSLGSFVVGTAAIATNTTDGFLYVPTCAGTPTGTPTTQTGTAPIVIDTTNNKLYFYSGGQWRDAGP